MELRQKGRPGPPLKRPKPIELVGSMIDVPNMKPEELEKILEHLPEPHSAKVSFWGDFEYSTVYEQGEEVVSGTKLCAGEFTSNLEDVSKEKILNVYRSSYNIQNADFGIKKDGTMEKRIDLDIVRWYIHPDTIIELTPGELSVSYNGKESEYVAKLRQVLPNTKVRFEITEHN